MMQHNDSLRQFDAAAILDELDDVNTRNRRGVIEQALKQARNATLDEIEQRLPTVTLKEHGGPCMAYAMEVGRIIADMRKNGPQK